MDEMASGATLLQPLPFQGTLMTCWFTKVASPRTHLERFAEC